MISLIIFTSRRDIMGAFVNGTLTRVVAVVVARPRCSFSMLC